MDQRWGKQCQQYNTRGNIRTIQTAKTRYPWAAILNISTASIYVYIHTSIITYKDTLIITTIMVNRSFDDHGQRRALRYWGTIDIWMYTYICDYRILFRYWLLSLYLLISGLPPYPGPLTTPTADTDPLIFPILSQNLTSLNTQFGNFESGTCAKGRGQGQFSSRTIHPHL